MVKQDAVAKELMAEFFSSRAAVQVFQPIQGKIATIMSKLNPPAKNFETFNGELFATLVNIGVFLGNGTEERVKSGLRQLEDVIESNLKMNLKVNANEKCPSEQLEAAVTYFNAFKDRRETKLKPQTENIDPQTRSPYSKLLTRGLEKVEIQNGFAVTENGKVPVYVGRLSEEAFISASQSGKPFKDLVSPQHGEFTHRIQWYLVMSGKLEQSSTQSQNVLSVTGANAALLFKLINIVPRLWDYLFDRVVGGEPGTGGEDDYRGPEVLLEDLIKRRKSEYPLLSAILAARQKKRMEYNCDYESRKDYVARKLYLRTYEQLANDLNKKTIVDSICQTNYLGR